MTALEPHKVIRRIIVRYKLDEPLLIIEGRWINRYTGPGKRGYYLPWSIRAVEVSGEWGGEWVDHNGHRPRYWAQGRGPTMTKSGRDGAEYDDYFRLSGRGWGGRGDDQPTPPEILALIEQVQAMTREPGGWPE